MKKTISAAIMAAVLISCGGAAKQGQQCAEETKDCCKGVYSPRTVLDSAEYLLDKQIKIKANVTRVCHCGSNMTFTDMKDTTAQLYVLAGGDIPKFNQCLKGQHANITGSLRVKKYSKSDLDSAVIKLEAKLAEVSAKSDSASLKTAENIKAKIENTKKDNAEKNEWMTAHNSDFYPFYYFEAEKFADCCVKKNDPEAMGSAEDCGNKCAK